MTLARYGPSSTIARDHTDLYSHLVRRERPIGTKRQRTIFGTIWLRYCSIATAKRTQRSFLHIRCRCPICKTTLSSPVLIYNFWNSRRHCHSRHILFYRLVITLEPFKDWVRTQSQESWSAPGTCAHCRCLVLCFRKTAMVEISPAPGC